MSDQFPAHKFDYFDELSSMPTTPIRGSKILELVGVIAVGLQAIEDTLYGILSQRLLNLAVGFQLDQWGYLVGEYRGGLTDGEYRSFIRARILSNLSKGEASRLIEILAIITRASFVLYQPIYPAGMAFDYRVSDFPSNASAERIKAQMIEVAGSGIGVHYITESGVGFFGFDDDEEANGFDVGVFGELI